MRLVLCRNSRNDAVENDGSRRGESSRQASLRGSIYSETCMQRRSKAAKERKQIWPIRGTERRLVWPAGGERGEEGERGGHRSRPWVSLSVLGAVAGPEYTSDLA